MNIESANILSQGPSQTNSSDYYDDEDSSFIHAITTTTLPGDVSATGPVHSQGTDRSDESDLEPPPPTQPGSKRSRFPSTQQLERSTSKIPNDEPVNKIFAPKRKAEPDDAYGPSHFGDFGQYMRHKRAKLQVQNAEMGNSDQQSHLFDGVSIYINGYTQPSVQDLRELIVQHGGTFQPYLDNKGLVTHIVTCTLTPAKLREFKNMKVVRPEWLLECVKSGTLLPWRDFIYTTDTRLEDTQGMRRKTQETLMTTQSKTHDAPLRTDSISRMSTKPPSKTLELVRSVFPKPSGSTKDFSANPLESPADNQQTELKPRYASHTSNPNAQRAMADAGWRAANTSAGAGYIGGYYANSRLHHLSTWKAELKQLVQQAQEHAEAAQSSKELTKVPQESLGVGVSMRGADLAMRSPTAKGKGKAKAESVERVVMHCDFDCFFVAAGLVNRPHLKGKPVVVCHSQGGQGGKASTSEIASCSYEARNFGIKNGMSLQQARTLCPGVITIPYEFERYKEFSLKFYTILMAHADDLQAVSVDEALIDVTNAVAQYKETHLLAEYPAKEYAELIRTEVRKVTSCEISIGIAHNILLARIATRRAKPAGSYHLFGPRIQEVLAPMDIADLHGFGWSTKQKAQEKLGVTTLGELLLKSKSVLCDALGKGTGETLYDAVRGIDHKQLESDKPRKSVSCEINYGIRFENNDQAEAFIYQMATEVSKRLRDVDLIGRSITLKIMKRDPSAPFEPPKFLGHGACDLFNKQMPLIGPGGSATSDETIIGEHAWRLLKSFSFDPKELRGIGIQIQKLEPASGGQNVQPGQRTLPFQTAAESGSSTKGESSKSSAQNRSHGGVLGGPLPPAPLPPQLVNVEGAPEPSKVDAYHDIPSFSQVDMDVFAALPADIRNELEAEYKRRSTSPLKAESSKQGASAAQPLPQVVKNEAGTSHRGAASRAGFRGRGTRGIFPSRGAGRGIFPSRGLGFTTRGRGGNLASPPARNRGFNLSNLHKIAQDLRPGLNPAIIRRAQDKLPSWLKPRNARSRKNTVRVTDEQLKEYGYDPEVFAGLSNKVKREQLLIVRIVKIHGELPPPPEERLVLKPQVVYRPPDFVVYRAPKPQAVYRQPPFLKQRKGKGEKLYFHDKDDVQKVVGEWMERCYKWCPKEGDLAFFGKYLLDSVDSKKAGDGGVETAVAVLKWWLVLLRRYWGGCELEEEDGPEPTPSDVPGYAWWAAFRDIKAQMDVIARKRFGGKLSLR